MTNAKLQDFRGQFKLASIHCSETLEAQYKVLQDMLCGCVHLFIDVNELEQHKASLEVSTVCVTCKKRRINRQLK